MLLLVRGINVGGKNKVVMAQLRQELTELGLEKVETYINSGNIFFTSTAPKAQLVEKLEALFEVHYPFIQSFSLLSQEDYEEELKICQIGGPKTWLEKMSSFIRRAWMWIKSSRKWTVWNWKMKSFILENLGFSGENIPKNHTTKRPITNTYSRCLFTAKSPFVMLKLLTKSVKC